MIQMGEILISIGHYPLNQALLAIKVLLALYKSRKTLQRDPLLILKNLQGLVLIFI
jgi:hypothetical protein